MNAQPASAARDGQHDFDFNIGVWKSHIRRLQHPLTGSKEWIDVNGIVTVSKVWQGRANLEEIEADGSTGHLEGLTLRLYNPESCQWYLYWANSRGGTLGAPNVGEFKNGRGEFYSQDQFNGKTILVRQIYSDITQDSYHFEQAFSDDGGKTWEANWVASLTRESAPQTAQQQPSGDENRQRDFDFNFGRWKTHVSRLQPPLAGSTKWVEYEGTSLVRPVWNGRASLFELEVNGPAGHIEGLGLRLYNTEARQWSLNWANSSDPVMTTPMIGEFKNGRGDFIDREAFNGRTIFVRNGFTDITPNSSRFEQSFSDDGGRTWETNWIMTFTRDTD
ncbi:MAG TPA: hypothetical protein VKB86_22555 [Pyrinomonadaceae bacterium]|nr:hypothetical protein [Pyrinomonadaceae bacterium]